MTFEIRDGEEEVARRGKYYNALSKKMIKLFVENSYFKITYPHMHIDFNALEELKSNPYGEIIDYQFDNGYLWLEIGR